MKKKSLKGLACKSLAMVLACCSLPLGWGTTVRAASPEAVQAQFGTPMVDGVVDEIWNTATAYALEQPVLLDGTSATTKVMWDDNALYTLTEVVDGALDDTAMNAYQQDSLELFLDELYDKATSYQNDDVHYRVNYKNVKSVDNGDMGRFYTATTTTATGYLVETCIKFEQITPVNGLELGFDAQINACEGGNRSGTISIFDTTGTAYSNPSLLGKLVLAGKGEGSVSGAFPYDLITYLEQVKGRDLSGYTEETATEVTAKLTAAQNLLDGGSYTQQQLDDAYQAIETAVNNLSSSSGAVTPAQTDAIQAQFGTPLVDGNVDEAWANATPYVLAQPKLQDGASATTKIMWDDNALYTLTEVVDGSLDATAGNAYEQDSVELFLDELYDRATSYQNDDVHYRVNYKNVRSVDNGDMGRFYTAAITTETGYLVETCIRFNQVAPANGVELGFDAQINVCAGGGRSGTINIFDSTGNAYSNPSLLGKLVLQGKEEGSQTGAFPYGLMTYLEQVKGMELSVYTQETAAVVTAKVADAQSLLDGGVYTQQQLDDAYQAIDAAVKNLDDGSGYEAPNKLPASAEIPNVFKFADGSDVNAGNWEQRAAEIKSLYEYYMYGPMPDTTGEVVTYALSELKDETKEITMPDGTKNTVAAKTGEMTIRVEKDGKSSSFKALVALPSTAAPEGGYPVFTEIGASLFSWWPLSISDNAFYAAGRGYASFTLDVTQVAADSSGRTGAFYTLYPYGQSWQEQTGALVAWGWGAGKILDALENGAATELNINKENTILGGVSRYGKATAVAGAYDERFKVVVPACSGAGGMAMYRHRSQGNTYDLSEFGYVNDEGNANHLTGDNEHLGSLQSNDEGHWFNDNFKKFTSVEQFPMDQHFLASLIADANRYLFIVNGVVGEDWTNPEAMSLTYAAAKEVYDMLGISDNINLSVHLEGHSINLTDMIALLDYCDVKLYGKDRSQVGTDLRDVKTSVFLNQDNYNAAVFGAYVTNDLTDVDDESMVGLKYAVPCGSSYEVIKSKLPATVDIYVDTIRRIDAPIVWDVEGSSYDPASMAAQNLKVNGTVTLPDGILNPQQISLSLEADVIVTNPLSYGSDIVNGEIGEAYTQAKKYKAENVLDGATADSDDGTADITFMWDEAFLYMLAEVKDSDIYSAAGKGEQEDSISLTIAKDLTAGKDVKNFCFTAGGDAYSVGFDTSGFGAVKKYTTADGVYSNAEKTEEGYLIEACITWDSLGIEAKEAQVLAMEAVVNSCSTATAGQDFRRAIALTAYPENTESYKFWGMWDVSYNAGLYAKDLIAFSMDTKTVDTVAEDIGRYEMVKFADNFYENNVKPFPLQESYDAQKVADARAYALSAEATREGIAQQKQILADMEATLREENHNGKLMTQYGTPVVDGKADDALWEKAYPYKTNVTGDGQYAEIRTLWDEDAMYALVKVFDPTYDITGSDAHTKDSVEFFFLAPEDAEQNSFGKHGGQWRINRGNQVTVTFGMNEPFYGKATEMADGTGYVVEARLDFADEWKVAANTVLNFDIAVNLCANGGRTDAIAWTSSDCYSNPKTAGQIIYLETKAGESAVPGGYNPYALVKVLDKALAMTAEDYDAEDFAAYYDKTTLQQYYDDAISGKLSAEQIDTYYKNVINMMSQITYDGVHKSALGFEANHNLPDPFTMDDGSVVENAEDWAERHDEIQDLYEFYMYGKLPVAEETGLTKSFAVDAEDANKFNITVKRGEIEKSFSFKVNMPTGTAPEGGWPYIINYGGNIDGAQAAGYAVIDYSSFGDVAADDSAYKGVFYDLYPECKGNIYTTGVGPLAGRAWGVGLIIDCIEEGIGSLADLDPAKSAVTGFSFLGKTALVTGVLEERIAVTNPAHSGIAGAALLRYTSQGKNYTTEEYPLMEDDFLTTKTEPIGQAQGQGAKWVKSIFSDFIGSDSTPFDTHMLLSLVAPRGLFISSGYYDNGTDPEGMFGAYLGAQKVYKFLNAEGNIAYADFPTSHTTSADETKAFLQYLDYYFYGEELPEGFRDTVYDNSPDRAEYDVIKIPATKGVLNYKADSLDSLNAQEQKEAVAQEVLDMLATFADEEEQEMFGADELAEIERSVSGVLNISMGVSGDDGTLPVVTGYIGAMVNAGKNDMLTLALSTVASAERPAISEVYNRDTAVVFDMKLLKNQAEVTPASTITIRMKVPQGIDVNQVIKVLHYTDDANPDVLDTKRIGTEIEFAVKGFSKFVIVNPASSTGTPGDGGPQGGDGGSQGGNGGSQGGNGGSQGGNGGSGASQGGDNNQSAQQPVAPTTTPDANKNVAKKDNTVTVKQEDKTDTEDTAKVEVDTTEDDDSKLVVDNNTAVKPEKTEDKVADNKEPVKESAEESASAQDETETLAVSVEENEQDSNSTFIIIVVVAAVLIIAGGSAAMVLLKKRKDD